MAFTLSVGKKYRSTPPSSPRALGFTLPPCNAARSATESLVRSLNNLLERLHASVFLYLMTSVDTFISVSNYLAAPILIGAGLTIDGLITWSQASANNTSGVAKEKPVLLAMVLLGLAVLVGSLEVALIARLDPQHRLPVRGLLPSFLFSFWRRSTRVH